MFLFNINSIVRLIKSCAYDRKKSKLLKKDRFCSSERLLKGVNDSKSSSLPIIGSKLKLLSFERYLNLTEIFSKGTLNDNQKPL